MESVREVGRGLGGGEGGFGCRGTGGEIGHYAPGMFTGIIEQMGRIHTLRPAQAGPGAGLGAGVMELLVDASGWGRDFASGESVAVNGCCLTLVPRGGLGGESGGELGGGLLRFDVVPETLAKTSLGGLKPGARVNLERAATASTLLGGHVVQGHVEGVGRVTRVMTTPEWRVTVRVPEGEGGAELMPCITPKGSIAIEGVSLTIASVDVGASTFDVALIPTTLAKTTLEGLREGDPVNLETDILARTVVHYLRHFQSAGEHGG